MRRAGSGPVSRQTATVMLACALPLCVTPGLAAEEPADPIEVAYQACIDKDPSTAGMVACADTAAADWDKALNAIYRELTGALKGKALETLREAQRAWLAQREKEHALQGAIHEQLEGTMWGPVMADQRAALIKARTLQLRAYKSFLDDGRP